jgi:flavin reductase (DIM6/NTAB) family NADH-FMN oxidoreductase RutF
MRTLAYSPQPVAVAEYVNAIAQHVSSVCVVTTQTEGKKYGLTATAVASVTADPPRLLVCVNRSNATHPQLLKSRSFCVNVLTEDQDKVAMVFAGMGGRDVDRFADAEWTELVTGAPVLLGAAAAFDCVLSESCEQSTHTVFFGDVVATRHRTGVDTLLYGARRFRQLRKVFAAYGDTGGDYL